MALRRPACAGTTSDTYRYSSRAKAMLLLACDWGIQKETQLQILGQAYLRHDLARGRNDRAALRDRCGPVRECGATTSMQRA
ncbi:MAG TPA: hypothetical protein VGC86_13835 [Afipia sp.]